MFGDAKLDGTVYAICDSVGYVTHGETGVDFAEGLPDLFAVLFVVAVAIDGKGTLVAIASKGVGDGVLLGEDGLW